MIFSDKDFEDFKIYISDKEYIYQTETEKKLEQLKEKASEEKYFTEIEKEYDILSLKIQENKNDDLAKNKEQIREVLTNEIVSRYYYQRGRIIAALNFDIEVEKAIEILQDTQLYNQILNNE